MGVYIIRHMRFLYALITYGIGDPLSFLECVVMHMLMSLKTYCRIISMLVFILIAEHYNFFSRTSNE